MEKRANCLFLVAAVGLPLSFFTPHSTSPYLLFSLLLAMIFGIERLVRGGALDGVSSAARVPRVWLIGAAFVFVAAIMTAIFSEGGMRTSGSLSKPMALCALMYWYVKGADIPAAWVLSVVLASAVVIGLISGVQFWVFDAVRSGGSGNPIMYSTVATIVACLSFYWAIYTPGRWRFWLFLAMLCAGTGVVFSGTRTAWVALTVSIVVIVKGKMLLSTTGSRRVSVVLALVLAAVTLLLAQDPVIQDRVNHTYTEVSNVLANDNLASDAFTTSFGIRVSVWYAALVALAENPWGLDASGFSAHVSEMASQGRLNAWFEVSSDWHPHNQFLYFAVYNGWFGAVAFLVLVVTMIATAVILRLKTESSLAKRYATSAQIVTLVALFFSLTDVTFSRNYSGQWVLWVYVIFISLSVMAGTKLNRPTQPELPSN